MTTRKLMDVLHQALSRYKWTEVYLVVAVTIILLMMIAQGEHL